MDFTIYRVSDAPADGRPTLERIQKKYGFVPNLMGILAESPAALDTYVSTASAFDRADLSPVERQVVLLAVSLENGCPYCVAAQSTAARMAGAPDDVLDALRQGVSLPDPRLEALRRFTRAVVRERGWVTADEVEAFVHSGFSKRHVLDVLTGVALKTLSNYTNHLAGTPVDDVFRPFDPSEYASEFAVEQPCCTA